MSRGRGNDFWSGKISLRRNVLYLAVRPPIPETSLTNFTSIFSSFCFSFRPTPCPSTNPRAIIGQCQYLVTGIYRRDATRRQPSPVYSPVAGPFYSSSAPPLPIVSVHYQHPGNDHEISQTRGKFPNEFCIRGFNSHQVPYHRYYVKWFKTLSIFFSFLQRNKNQ